METDRTNLGEKTDIEAVLSLLPVSGLSLVDVGCGPGLTSRALAAQGARVLAVEPDPVQAEKNRNAEPVPGLRFVEGGAEQLPLADNSVDGVLFFRSLHHVPVEHMDAALTEAARVLKPDTGFLCIIEPGMTGTHFQVMRPFHDETRVRTAAQAALARTARDLFRERSSYRFAHFPRYPDFETMVERFVGTTFNAISRERVETDEVRALFESGRTTGGDHVFDQPMLMDLYRAPAK